jgi:hypothetical protein
MKKKLLFLSLVLTNGMLKSNAQSVACDHLTVPCVNTVSTNGFYIDVEPVSDVTITYFATVSQNPGSRDMEIYYKQGSFVGSETNSGDWTLVGSATGFEPDTSIACPIPQTQIPIAVNICALGGQRTAFYIMKVNGTGTFEANDTYPVNGILEDDGALKVYAGKVASGYSTFTNIGLRDSISFQGSINYQCGCSNGVKNAEVLKAATLYPNPVQGELQINLHNYSSDQCVARLVDLTGKQILSQEVAVENQSLKMNVNSLASGMYYVQIINPSDGTIVTNSRFVKN